MLLDLVKVALLGQHGMTRTSPTGEPAAPDVAFTVPRQKECAGGEVAAVRMAPGMTHSSAGWDVKGVKMGNAVSATRVWRGESRSLCEVRRGKQRVCACNVPRCIVGSVMYSGVIYLADDSYIVGRRGGKERTTLQPSLSLVVEER